MQNYTPVPTPFTGDIELPQDVIDPVVVGTVNPAFQQLADAAALNSSAVSFRGYLVGGSVVADGAHIPIDESEQHPAGAWTLSSNEIEAPRAGVYQVTAYGGAATAGVGSPYTVMIEVRIGTAEGRMSGVRWSASTSDIVPITGGALATVVTPASSKFWFRNVSAADITVGASDDEVRHEFIITYLGEP